MGASCDTSSEAGYVPELEVQEPVQNPRTLPGAGGAGGAGAPPPLPLPALPESTGAADVGTAAPIAAAQISVAATIDEVVTLRDGIFGVHSF
jgi:hypothetical protein